MQLSNPAAAPAASSTARPAAQYQARLAQHLSALRLLEGRSLRLSHARLITFMSLVAVLGAAWGGACPAWPAGLPAAAFVVLAILHDRVLRQQGSLRHRQRACEDGLLRVAQKAPPGAYGGPPPPPDHPYAADLDLFGATGLMPLLGAAHTAVGRATTVRWLLQPLPSAAAAAARQQAVRDLADQLRLREDMAVLGARHGAQVADGLLCHWAEAPTVLPKSTRTWLRACHVATLAGLLCSLAGFGNAPLLVALLAQWACGRSLRRSVSQVISGLQEPARELPLLAELIGRLQAAPGPALAATLAPLRGGDAADADAGAAIAALNRLGRLHDLGGNQLVAPLAWLGMLGTHVAWRVEAWRRRHGKVLRTWLQALGEAEALLALSTYAFDNPDDVWPEVVDAAAGPCLRATGLCHPLLPDARAVQNDVHLDASRALYIVSGSNMSGKSTLLRAVGINVVLALCGAPVRARSLRLTPLAVGATLRVQDSLADNTSRFYAELKRLRLLKDTAEGPLPLLFLLDEILHGTNSHDRDVGAAAVLAALRRRGALGLVTTHDLSLSQRAAELQGHNVHFTDVWAAGTLHFDYRMRDGIVDHSNALIFVAQALGEPLPAESAAKGSQ